MRVDRTQSIAIIGAGASGLYLTYRLQKAGFRNVRVFETRARVGGRMHDHQIGAHRSEIALGAQSFSDAHVHVSGLCAHLGLKRRELAFVRAGFALRGARCDGAAQPGVCARYGLADEGAAGDAYALLLKVIGAVAPDFARYWRDDDALFDYLQNCVVDGRALSHWGFWPLIAAKLDPEACAFVRDCLGLRSCVAVTQAAGAIFTLLWEMRPGQTHFALEGGFSALGERLYSETARGDVYRFTSTLEGVTTQRAGFRLRFRRDCGAREVFDAETVILTCPPAALKAVEFDDQALASLVASACADVAEINASKLFLLFEQPWRADAGAARVIHTFAADAPLALVLGEADQSGAQLFTIFGDGENAHFWASFARVSDAPASPEAIVAAQRALERAVGQALGAPLASWWIDWSRAGEGAAWHAWSIGADAATTRGRILHPQPDKALFICGEAFATPQGWVEGALSFAEMVLERHFGMTRPHWLRGHNTFEISPKRKIS
jgi:monoamine oxidase